MMGEGREPRCVNCQSFKKIFVDDHIRNNEPNRIYDGMCTLEPVWQSISHGDQHYCSHHKSTMPPQSTGPR